MLYIYIATTFIHCFMHQGDTPSPRPPISRIFLKVNKFQSVFTDIINVFLYIHVGKGLLYVMIQGQGTPNFINILVPRASAYQTSLPPF